MEQRVGRLVEVRYHESLTLDDFTRLMAKTRTLFEASSLPLVFVTDARYVSPFPRDVADSLVWVMRRDNPKIAAGGILLSRENLMWQRQAERILMEARNTVRRLFFEPLDLAAWLSPHLDGDERRRLDAFLLETWAK